MSSADVCHPEERRCRLRPDGTEANVTQEEPEDRQPDYTVPALQRGLAILSLFGRENPTISIVTISRRLAIPRATTFRLVWTLVQEGFLVRSANGSEVALGPRILTLGFGYLQSQGLIELARPILERLRDRIGASTHMGLLEDVEVLYVVRAPSHQRLSSNRYVGSRIEAHSSSLGRALLHDHSADAVARLFHGKPMVPRDEHTPTTPAALAAALAEDRAKGFVSGRFVDGILSIAAPVRDASDAIVAAINVSDYESLDGLQDVDAVKNAVLEAALEISRLLGFQGASVTS